MEYFRRNKDESTYGWVLQNKVGRGALWVSTRSGGHDARSTDFQNYEIFKAESYVPKPSLLNKESTIGFTPNKPSKLSEEEWLRVCKEFKINMSDYRPTASAGDSATAPSL